MTNTDLDLGVYLRCRCVLTGCSAIALLDVHLSTPGYPLAGGAPRCRLGLRLNANRYKMGHLAAGARREGV
jgi:hypothetical protein